MDRIEGLEENSRVQHRPLTTKKGSDLSQTSSVATTTANGDASTEAKQRLPPSKAQVGLARSPDLKNCKSKIGSLQNIKHTPTGGKFAIQTQKLNWNAKSKVGSLDNKEHKPAGGNIKVESKKLEWNTSSKVQSLVNINHKPGGGNVRIFNETYRDKTTLPDFNKRQQSQSCQVKSEFPTALTCSKEVKAAPRRPATAVVAKGIRSRDPTNKLTQDLKEISLKGK